MSDMSFTITLEHDLFNEVSSIAKANDIGLETLTVLIYQYLADKHCIPFASELEISNEETLKAMSEAEQFFAKGKQGRFTNAHDLIQDALS